MATFGNVGIGKHRKDEQMNRWKNNMTSGWQKWERITSVDLLSVTVAPNLIVLISVHYCFYSNYINLCKIFFILLGNV